MESQGYVMVAKQFTFHIDINTRKKITFHFGFILNETNTDCFNLAIFFSNRKLGRHRHCFCPSFGTKLKFLEKSILLNYTNESVEPMLRKCYTGKGDTSTIHYNLWSVSVGNFSSVTSLSPPPPDKQGSGESDAVIWKWRWKEGEVCVYWGLVVTHDYHMIWIFFR